jgi:sarcosine oxidase subunit alpha
VSAGPSPFRLPEGGLIDRDRPLDFRFDGRAYRGFAGDTLASALLANGVRVVGRSLKYHRSRGVFTAGPEEPSAIVRVGGGVRATPNLRATEVPLHDGLEARSQNAWPGPRFDLGALAGLAAPLLPPGFYYKTFMWPAGLWRGYEQVIRRAAGLGRAPTAPDPDHYDKCHAHCDVLVVGGGPAGLAAALAAGAAGARVGLCDERPEPGGALLNERAELNGEPAAAWARGAADRLAGMPNVTLLTRASAFGCYDGNLVLIAEQLGTESPYGEGARLAERLWKVRAGEVVLAAGAIERPLVFAGNDRPGVMLASAARAYVNHYAVRPGRRAVIFTNNESGYASALDLADAGVEVAAVVDARLDAASAAGIRGVEVLAGHAVVDTRGRAGLKSVAVAPLDGAGRPAWIDCDLLCLAGGWSPSVHLFSHRQGRLRFDDAAAAFVPDGTLRGLRVVGAAAGRFALADCLAEGSDAGREAARAAGFSSAEGSPLPRVTREPPVQGEIRPLWAVPRVAGRRGKRFVDLQNDVTAEDLALAVGEGYRSIEHVKRYTATGMGTDQGKTSNVNAIGIVAGLTGAGMAEVGVTTFRPPYTPVTFGTVVGRQVGTHLAPIRRTPFHRCHEAAGVVFDTSGDWHYPRYYPKDGESMAEAVVREVRTVRSGVGMVDMSTLGKIDLQGPDAPAFLERAYANGFTNLPVGRARYGIMLREDGIVLDDGTVSRLGAHHYLVTVTTANTAHVVPHLEKLHQVHWPDLDVKMLPVSEQWASLAVAGPRAREVLAALAPDFETGNEAFPFMGVREGAVAGIPARVFRISFSGELSYEINVPSDFASALWQALAEAGAPFGLTPYGLEALDVLRIEKGHVAVGAEIDGCTTADDLGLGRLLSRKKPFLGQRLLERAALRDPARPALVGLVPADGRSPIPEGAQIVERPWAGGAVPSLGHVTATVYSPTLDMPIGLALVADGRARIGGTLVATSPLAGRNVEVTLRAPVFVDPDGERLRG